MQATEHATKNDQQLEAAAQLAISTGDRRDLLAYLRLRKKIAMTFSGQNVAETTPIPADAEDLSDIVDIVSPFETPLLHHIGDSFKADGDPYHSGIYRAHVQASKSNLSTGPLADELDYQMQERLRELLRGLENDVINGTGDDASIAGIIPALKTNVFVSGGNNFCYGKDEGHELSEEQLHCAIQGVWDESDWHVDTIVVGGYQKRRINHFAGYSEKTSHKGSQAIYRDDYGLCYVILSRWVPPDAVLLLDSSAIDVTPVAGRSFHCTPVAQTDESDTRLIVGEYSLDISDEKAHGLIRGLAHA